MERADLEMELEPRGLAPQWVPGCRPVLRRCGCVRESTEITAWSNGWGKQGERQALGELGLRGKSRWVQVLEGPSASPSESSSFAMLCCEGTGRPEQGSEEWGGLCVQGWAGQGAAPGDPQCHREAVPPLL